MSDCRSAAATSWRGGGSLWAVPRRRRSAGDVEAPWYLSGVAEERLKTRFSRRRPLFGSLAPRRASERLGAATPDVKLCFGEEVVRAEHWPR